MIGTPTVVMSRKAANVNVNGNLVASGSISISDVTRVRKHFKPRLQAQGNLGSLVLNANGTYTYTVANNATEYLDAGQTKVDSFTITSIDGTTQQVSFDIHGTNQAAVIGTPTVTDVTEGSNVTNGNLVASGSISISDVNQGEAAFQRRLQALKVTSAH